MGRTRLGSVSPLIKIKKRKYDTNAKDSQIAKDARAKLQTRRAGAGGLISRTSVGQYGFYQ